MFRGNALLQTEEMLFKNVTKVKSIIFQGIPHTAVYKNVRFTHSKALPKTVTHKLCYTENLCQGQLNIRKCLKYEIILYFKDRISSTVFL